MDIPNINNNSIQVREVDVPQLDQLDITNIMVRNDWNIPPVQTFSPPVTIDLGNPIVDIPGCVEAHETNNPLNEQISSDDPRGTLTFCDGSLPSFNPPYYNPLQTLPTPKPEIDTRFNTEDKPVEPSSLPATEAPQTPPQTISCPTPGQEAKEPVGSYINGYRERIVEYKLIGNECVRITEDVGLPQQIVSGLPSGGQVVQVGSIAVVATTSALLAKPLADLLLKVVKPTVKKVMKKIAKIRGKQLKSLSVRERQEEQRDRNQAIAKLRAVKAKTK